MFEPNSRYFPLEIKTLAATDENGEQREIRYVVRRFIPDGTGPTLLEHTVIQGERLDQITAKYLGDPTQFWRVADANQAMAPEELTGEIGRRIIIALPQS